MSGTFYCQININWTTISKFIQNSLNAIFVCFTESPFILLFIPNKYIQITYKYDLCQKIFTQRGDMRTHCLSHIRKKDLFIVKSMEKHSHVNVICKSIIYELIVMKQCSSMTTVKALNINIIQLLIFAPMRAIILRIKYVLKHLSVKVISIYISSAYWCPFCEEVFHQNDYLRRH